MFVFVFVMCMDSLEIHLGQLQTWNSTYSLLQTPLLRCVVGARSCLLQAHQHQWTNGVAFGLPDIQRYSGQLDTNGCNNGFAKSGCRT